MTKRDARKQQKSFRFVGNTLDRLSVGLRPLLDQLLADTKAAETKPKPRAFQTAKQIEEMLVKAGITPRHTLVAAPPKPKTLANRPLRVQRAEYAAVKKAEQEFSREWTFMPRHLTDKARREDPQAYDHGLAKARANARAEFRAQQAREQDEAAKAKVDLPAHIKTLDKPPTDFLDLKPAPSPSPRRSRSLIATGARR